METAPLPTRNVFGPWAIDTGSGAPTASSSINCRDTMQLDVTDIPRGEVTRLLRAARSGDRNAIDQIVPLVYEDLRALAGRRLRREMGQRTMQPTSLVH